MLHNNEIITLIDNTISRLYAQQKGDPVVDLPEYVHDTEMVFYKGDNTPMVVSSIRQLSMDYDHAIDEMESDQVLTNDTPEDRLKTTGPEGGKYACRISDLTTMCVNELSQDGNDEDKAEFLLFYCGILAANVMAHTPDFSSRDYYPLVNYFYNQFIPFQGAMALAPRDYNCQMDIPDIVDTLLRCLGGENCFSTYDLYIGINTQGAFLTEDNIVSVLNHPVSGEDTLLKCDLIPLYEGEYASVIEDVKNDCLALSHIISLAHTQEATDSFWNNLVSILFSTISDMYKCFPDQQPEHPIDENTVVAYVQKCREAKRQG